MNSERSFTSSEGDSFLISSHNNALIQSRAITAKSLLDIHIDSLSVDASSKAAIKKAITNNLELILPSGYDDPMVQDTLHQWKQCLKTMIDDEIAKHSNLNANMDSIQTNICTEIMKMSKFRSDFTMTDKLGSGGFGTIYKVMKNSNSRLYAVKKMKISGDGSDIDDSCKREMISDLASLSHLNIIKYFDWWTEYDPFPEENEDFSSSTGMEDSESLRGRVLCLWEQNAYGMTNIFLYIQMELCDEDLAIWLEKRNREIELI